jgi:hypothetical protein
MTKEAEILNKLKAKYHEKFRKNIAHNVPYFEQLEERAFKEIDNHSAMDAYREKPITPMERLEIHALNELIKVYRTQIVRKEVKYHSC